MHGVKRVILTEELRLEKKKRDREKVEIFKTLATRVENIKEKDENVKNLKELLLTLNEQLVMNPDLTTSYNLRRSTILKLKFSNEDWDKELNFTTILLTKSPKSYPIWQHRCWILSQLNSVIYYEKELKLTFKLLAMDKRNFHGWSYRRDILDILYAKLDSKNMDALYSKEWEFLTEMINSDISNYSAWHQRRTLLLYYIGSKENKTPKQNHISIKQLLEEEADYLYQAIFTDAEDQSVWNYLKWFITDSKISSIFTNEENKEILDKYISAMNEINEDEFEFNGKWNKYCSLLLIYIKDNLRKERVDIVKSVLLESLVKSDPLRKNRYLELLDKI
ncbi:hypothetical protein QEN19_001564 [Hanseniaspora menglaensis]